MVVSGNVDAFIKAKDDLALEESKGEPKDPTLGVSTINNSMNHERRRWSGSEVMSLEEKALYDGHPRRGID